jgi:probable F420-dependent oxidoreductase
MKFGFFLLGIGPRHHGTCAIRAESCGYESIWLPEHLVMPEEMPATYPYTADHRPGITTSTPLFDPWVAMAAMAGVTKTIRFGTAVYVLPLRHPIITARSLVTLDRVSGGRVTLGAGAGWLKEEFDAMGLPFERRGKLMDEVIPLLRRLWADEVIVHDGPFYRFGPVRFEPKPLQKPSIPIEIGGSSAAALRRAALLGDGWVEPGSRDLEDMVKKLGTIREHRKTAGRDGLPFEVTLIANNIFNTPGDVRRAEDMGVTRIVVSALDSPYVPLGGMRSQAHIDFIERYADAVISKM